MCVCTHAGQRLKLGVDWNHFRLILTQGLWLILDHWFDYTAGQQAPGMLLTPFPVQWSQVCVAPHAFDVGAGNPNSCLHACMTSSLVSLLPTPLSFFFLIIPLNTTEAISTILLEFKCHLWRSYFSYLIVSFGSLKAHLFPWKFWSFSFHVGGEVAAMDGILTESIPSHWQLVGSPLHMLHL